MRLFKPGFLTLLLLGLAVFAPHGYASSPTAPSMPQPGEMDPSGDITLQIGNTTTTFKRAGMQTLSQSFIKLTGVDLNDDRMIDDFAKINYCDLFQRYYSDEFSWRQAREALRRVVQRELESYPENIYLLGTIRLGRYDFEHKAFMLDEESRFNSTGVFRFQDRSFNCQSASIEQMPSTYSIRLSNPITLDRINVPENKAQNIADIMKQQDNRDRKVYLTFFLRINDFSSQNSVGTTQIRANVRATLLSMRFYLDRARKIQIYEYTGNE